MFDLRNFFLSIVPKSWARAMEAESKQWIGVCSKCGQESSVWEQGGIRWKATGRPRHLWHCPICERRTWYRLEWRASGTD